MSSSLPNQPTFLDSYKKIYGTEKTSKETSITEHYKKEIKYLEQELEYWITENGMSPSETKDKKIKELAVELKNVKETYENIIQQNK